MGFWEAIGVQEFKDFNILRRLFAELLGTFIYVIILLLGLTSPEYVVANALATGLMVASVVAIIGHVSGGHINPAITVGAVACEQIKLLPGLCYILVQFVGAVLGALLVRYLMSGRIPRGIHHLDAVSMFCLEVLFTFLLVSVAVSVMDFRKGTTGIAGALAIGVSIIAPLCAVTNYRGTMNPALSMALSMYYNDYPQPSWVFCNGPPLGGFLAGLVNRYILNPPPPPPPLADQ